MPNITAPDSQPHDVAVIGGSFAGLAAAIQLARGRRRVLIVDGGQPRNRFAAHSHGFLGQDGRPPLEILATAREQVLAYPTVEWVSANVRQIRKGPEGFEVETQDGRRAMARRVLLTYGVTDHLPAIEGLRALWGSAVFHCPYCHAYEFGDRPLGIVATGPASIHQALMLPEWSPDVILFTNDAMTPTDEERAQIEGRGVRIEETPINRVIGEGQELRAVELADGRIVERAGLLVAPQTFPSSSLHEALGCEVEEIPTGVYVKTDGLKETTVPGVFASGDLARPFGSVSLAVGDGAFAGASVHRSLIMEDAGIPHP